MESCVCDYFEVEEQSIRFDFLCLYVLFLFNEEEVVYPLWKEIYKRDTF